MKEKLRYRICPTRFGWVGVLGSARGLRRTTLPQPTAAEARAMLGPESEGAIPGEDLFDALAERLRRYFAGEVVLFSDALDLSGRPRFFCSVWRQACRIAYGEQQAYHWLAEQAGSPRACRAAGQAMARNPLPIIVPCHRVVGSDGSLCGFGGGLVLKQRLLDLEAQRL
jgi:methylated-DNA-[protein]-cysteine S-methyltransferase